MPTIVKWRSSKLNNRLQQRGIVSANKMRNDTSPFHQLEQFELDVYNGQCDSDGDKSGGSEYWQNCLFPRENTQLQLRRHAAFNRVLRELRAGQERSMGCAKK
jgi:hypothetical protein